ncbi:MAG: HD domain-containing protein [Clostridia bacterium]
MELNEMIEILKERLETMFSKDKSGHSIDHLLRTMKNALLLQKQEGGNKKVVAISALIHDIHRIMVDENRNFVSPKESLPKVRELIADIDLTNEEKDHICYAIEHHEEYSFGGGKVTVNDIESKILQDADNLDGTGAIGVARAFAFGSAYKIPLYDENLSMEQGEYSESGNFDESTIHHCVNKLMRLDQTMNTKTGKEICKQRCAYIKNFVDEFISEWKGEK